VSRLLESRKIDGQVEEDQIEGKGDMDNVAQGVRQCFVPGAGHHLQNDVMWEVGAKKLLDFYEQL